MSPVACADLGTYRDPPIVLLTRETPIYIYLLSEGRNGIISARVLDSTDRAQRGPYK